MRFLAGDSGGMGWLGYGVLSHATRSSTLGWGCLQCVGRGWWQIGVVHSVCAQCTVHSLVDFCRRPMVADFILTFSARNTCFCTFITPLWHFLSVVTFGILRGANADVDAVWRGFGRGFGRDRTRICTRRLYGFTRGGCGFIRGGCGFIRAAFADSDLDAAQTQHICNAQYISALSLFICVTSHTLFFMSH